MRFVDEAKITVRSGKGGAGCVSFLRERFVPKGGPDGGDGGRGGDVFFRADPRLHTLYDFTRKRLFAAENGRPGMGRQKCGRAGEDLYISVPVGTQIHEVLESGEAVLLHDLSREEEVFKVAEGGRGGKGNVHFKSSTMRAPRFAQAGEQGEDKSLALFLKIIADVGLIGLPNAGKSTLISAISAARPKTAPYPFTTTSPSLGVVFGDSGEKITVADIPGLVEGAHQGHGLGDRFLKHVERTGLLVHILSAEDVSPENIRAGFDLVNDELAGYDPELAKKDQIPVLNKIDLLSDQELKAVVHKAKEQGIDLFCVSALNGTGIEDLLRELWSRLAGGHVRTS